MNEREYFIYIMSSFRRALYTGITNNLALRIWQHKCGKADSFTAKYNIDRLVYAESFRYVRDAIAREKQIKKWRREKKVKLILSLNPGWENLAEVWRLIGDEEVRSLRSVPSGLRSG